VKPKSETNFWTDGAAITNPQVVQLERRGVKIGDW
jgi:hypothetical protein